MSSQPNKDVDKVAGFFSQLAISLMDGEGLKVNVLEVMPVVSAGKRLVGKEGREVFVESIRRIETAHPEIWDLLLASSSEAIKDRISKALSKRKDIDVTPE